MFQEIKVKHRSLREILPTKHEKFGWPSPPRRLTKHWWRGWWWFSGAFALVALIYFVSLSFASVTIEVTPVQLAVSLNDNFVATESGVGLNFDVIALPAKMASRTVKAVGTEKVSRSASGQIVVYNNYNKENQKLIANTRFQATNGKIYRLREALIVPGMKVVSGKTVPGSVEATIYADRPGADYNGEPTDFTIPGFKGDPRFAKFFARSKTSLTGGFVGEVRKLSAAEAEKARKALSADLSKELLLEARAKIPASFVLFGGLTLVEVKDVSDLSASSTGDSAVLKASATFQGVMLPRQALTETLTKGRSGSFSSTEVTITNLDQLPVTFTDTQTGNLAEVKNLSFRVSGLLRLVPTINRLDLATQLAGMAKSAVPGFLARQKGLAQYRVIYRPIWLTALPADPAKIEVKLPAY